MALQAFLGAAPADAELQLPSAQAAGLGPLPRAVDRYFESEQNVVATFDFDYETIISFRQQVSWVAFLVCPPCWSTTICAVPCFLNQNIEWSARAQHVAITTDGIKYVTEKRPSLWGLACCDQGRVSRTVPYDKITDCDVSEPAGNACCCCVPNVLSTVRVDTASSGRESGPELSLIGLKHPHEFKQSVWAMKRSQASNQAVAAPAQVQMPSVQLLQEIRDELRQLNAFMRAQAGDHGVKA